MVSEITMLVSNTCGTNRLVNDECILLQCLQGDVDKSLDAFMKISSVVTQADEKTKTVACECAGLYCLIFK